MTIAIASRRKSGEEKRGQAAEATEKQGGAAATVGLPGQAGSGMTVEEDARLAAGVQSPADEQTSAAVRSLPPADDWAGLNAALRRYCLSLTGSVWEADDLAQDAWLKAKRIWDGEGHANPEALLLRIAKHTWIDRARRSAALSRILRRERAETASQDNSLLELEAVFQSLTRHLSVLQRTVFLLRDVLGYSIAETAARLDTSEGAVKAAHHRARGALARVRADLEEGSPSASPAFASPSDESLNALLRAFAAAYRQGDIAALVALSQQGEAEPTAVLGLARQRLAADGAAAGQRAGGSPTARMAA